MTNEELQKFVEVLNEANSKMLTMLEALPTLTAEDLERLLGLKDIVRVLLSSMYDLIDAIELRDFENSDE